VVSQPQDPIYVHQPRGHWVFAQDGVSFDNEFAGAHLNDVQRLGPDQYLLEVDPENKPINPSPWFAFRVQSQTPQTLQLKLTFDGDKPRYQPQFSSDRVHWQEAASCEAEAKQTCAEIAVGNAPLWVAGQPLITGRDVFEWSRSMAQRPDVTPLLMGMSTQERALYGLRIGSATPKDGFIVAIARQHPPETPGSVAFRAFFETVAADTPLARAFRKRYTLVGVPMMNPDGVYEGHWRQAAGGIDINRDWGGFTQPETRDIRDRILELAGGNPARLRFAVDFHATWNNVIYTVKEDIDGRPDGLTQHLVTDLMTQFPDQITEKRYNATSEVFKNWAYKALCTPAITFEMADGTDPEEIAAIARETATQVMRELTSGKSPPPSCRGPAQ